MTPGRRLLQQDVAGGDEGGEVALVVGAAEIEHDRAFAGVVVDEIAAGTAVLRLPAAGSFAAGGFDLDDLRAEAGQQHAGERAGGVAGDLDDADAG